MLYDCRGAYPDSPAWLGFLPFPLILSMFIAHAFYIAVVSLICTEAFPTAIRKKILKQT